MAVNGGHVDFGKALRPYTQKGTGKTYCKSFVSGCFQGILRVISGCFQGASPYALSGRALCTLPIITYENCSKTSIMQKLRISSTVCKLGAS